MSPSLLERASAEQLAALDSLYRMTPNERLLATVARIADDVGRLRRRFRSNGGWTGEYLVDRIAGHLDTIDAALRPTAAEIAAMWAPGDDEAVDEALRIVDEQQAELYRRMGRS